MNLLSRLRSARSAMPKTADDGVLGYMLQPDGRVEAVKYGGFGNTAFNYLQGYDRLRGEGLLNHTSQGYAYATYVSVWVYRCVNILASAESRVPWQVYQAGTKKIIPNHPLARALKRNRQHIIRRIARSMALFGEAFIEKAINDFGYPADLYWLNNLGMYVGIDATGIFEFQYTPVYAGAPQTFAPQEIAFYKTDNSFDDLRGQSPLDSILDDVGIDQQIGRVIRSFYINDARPGMLFIPKTTIQPSDAQRFVDELKKNFQGPNNAGKPALMPFDMTVSETQKKPSLDDTDLRENVRRVICAGFGVPLSIAGAWDDAKYQSAPEQRRSLYEDTIIPLYDDLQDFVNIELMPFFDTSGNAEFRGDYTSMLALTEDANKKGDTVNSRLLAGQITRNEARIQQGDAPDPGGNVFYIPSGVTVVPANEMALVTPSNSTVDTTAQEQTADKPAAPGATPAKPQIGAPKPPRLPANTPSPQALSSGKPANPVAPPNKVKLPPAKMRVVEVGDRYQAMFDDLFAWQTKAKNKGAIKAFTFHSDALPVTLQDYVRSWLGGDTANVREAFATARKFIAAVKSYDDTRFDFETDLTTAINAALSDLVSRASFGGVMRAMLKRAGTQAYLDGFDEEELDEIGQNAVDDWVAQNSEYVSAFADRVFAEGLSPTEVESHVDMWGNKALGDIYMQGLVRDQRDQRFMWVWDESIEQHCVDCERLNGQVHRLSQWTSRGWVPQGDRLKCGGFKCGCKLEQTDDPSQGRF